MLKSFSKFKDEEIKENSLKKMKKAMPFGIAIIRAAFLLCMSYVLIFPLFYMVSMSFQSSSQILDPSVVWVPTQLSLDNFSKAMQAMEYFKAFWFTFRVHIISALIEIITCAIIAYGFARFNFKGRNLIFGLVIITILVPQEMIIIPLYDNFKNFDPFGTISLIQLFNDNVEKINMVNTGWTFYIPSLLGCGLKSGILIFIYRQFFKGLPVELEEAASIDGAGPIKTFVKIVMPSSSVAIVTVTIFSLIWHWNEYYITSMYFTQEKSLSVALNQITDLLLNIGISPQANIVIGITMAGCVLTVLPMLIVYLVLQKYFIQSIDRVGIVG